MSLGRHHESHSHSLLAFLLAMTQSRDPYAIDPRERMDSEEGV